MTTPPTNTPPTMTTPPTKTPLTKTMPTQPPNTGALTISTTITDKLAVPPTTKTTTPPTKTRPTKTMPTLPLNTGALTTSTTITDKLAELTNEVIGILALAITTTISLLLIYFIRFLRRCLKPSPHDSEAPQRPHPPQPFPPDVDAVSMQTLNLSEDTNTDEHQSPEQSSSPFAQLLPQSNSNSCASSKTTVLQVVTPEMSSSASSPVSPLMHASSSDLSHVHSPVTPSSDSSQTPLMPVDRDDTVQPPDTLLAFRQE